MRQRHAQNKITTLSATAQGFFHVTRSTVTSARPKGDGYWETSMKSPQAAVRALLMYMALASPLGWADTPATHASTDQQCGGEPCGAVIRGLFPFFDRDLHGLEGNGRSCNDCHMVTEQFRLTPAAVESRYQFLQKRRRHNPY